MNGAESLVRTLVKGGVEVCFANPGTSEMHFVGALDRVEGMRCVLGLFEGVCSGAADGYYRMTDKPASTLLHLGPGLANAAANLHNAKKAGSGVVNIVGEHALYHIKYDTPLTADIEGIARPFSHWVKTSPTSKTVAGDGALAIQATRNAGTPLTGQSTPLLACSMGIRPPRIPLWGRIFPWPAASMWKSRRIRLWWTVIWSRHRRGPAIRLSFVSL